MLVPLVVLAIGAIAAGFAAKELFIGHEYEHFWRKALFTGPENYAIFTVLVEDVDATCRQVEKAGGQVRRPPSVNPVGVTFAHLLDPAGNHFSVFTPPK